MNSLNQVKLKKIKILEPILDLQVNQHSQFSQNVMKRVFSEFKKILEKMLIKLTVCHWIVEELPMHFLTVRSASGSCLLGLFNNYVDQMLPNFDPPTPPPSSVQKWTFYILSFFPLSRDPTSTFH